MEKQCYLPLLCSELGWLHNRVNPDLSDASNRVLVGHEADSLDSMWPAVAVDQCPARYPVPGRCCRSTASRRRKIT